MEMESGSITLAVVVVGALAQFEESAMNFSTAIQGIICNQVVPSPLHSPSLHVPSIRNSLFLCNGGVLYS